MGVLLKIIPVLLFVCNYCFLFYVSFHFLRFYMTYFTDYSQQIGWSDYMLQVTYLVHRFQMVTQMVSNYLRAKIKGNISAEDARVRNGTCKCYKVLYNKMLLCLSF